MSSFRIATAKYTTHALRKFAFCCACAVVLCQILYAICVIRLYWQPDYFVRPPLQLDRTGVVVHVEDEASQGGIKTGDLLVQFAGHSIKGMEDFRQSFERIAPGRFSTVQVKRQDGSESEATVQIRSVRQDMRALGGWIIPLIAFIVTPAIALSLGFLVVFIRPNDRNAWLIFGLMVATSQVLHFPVVETYLPQFVIRVRHLTGSSLGLWVALLAVSFPVKPRFDEQRPYVKFVCAAVFFLFLSSIVVIRMNSDSVFLAPSMQLVLVVLQSALYLMSLLAVVGLCTRWLLLFLRSRSLDVRRRLRTLAAGTLLSFAPLSILVLSGLATHRDPLTSAPRWANIVAIISLDLFPATLAYAVVVKRALDLSELLRLSVQYALARRGLLALRILSLGTLISYLILRTQSLDTGPQLDRPWLFTSVAVLLVLELAMTEHARSWLDQRFFRDSYKLEQVVAKLRDRQFGTAEALCQTVLELLVGSMHVMTGAIYLQSGKLFTPIAYTGLPNQLLRALTADPETIQRWLLTDTPLHIAWRTPESCVSKSNPEDLDVLRSLRAEVLAPIVRAGQVSGMLVLGSKKSESAYISRDLQLLKVVTAQMAIVLENLDLMNKVTAEAIERVRREAEARAAVESSKAKSMFIAQISHELRTPINAIISYSELLQEEAADEGQHWILPDLAKISNAGKTLLKLIGSVLDVTKIEAGRMELHLEHFPLGELIEECIALTEPLATKNSNLLIAELPPEPGGMFADSAKLKQSVLNLLSNAAKFTERGTIKLRVEAFYFNNSDWVRLNVSDTGIGMTEQQVSRLFVPFVQAEKGISKRFGGTGLGLAISRDFCRLMGGDVTLTSELGKGTQCVIELPRNSPGDAEKVLT